MTSLNIQLGARSLLSLGVSFGEIGALIQHGRTFGNWLRTRQNDEELFESMSEVYGEVLRRRGLVDTTLMASRWAHQMNFYNHGRIVRETIGSSNSADEQSLGRFSWLMVVLVTALDTCLQQYDFLPLLIEVFMKILDRDDGASLTESLQIQLQTNIESWRSTGRIRGMHGPVAQTVRACRRNLVSEDAVPNLNYAEKKELCEFLTWLMAGDTNHYQLVSATLFAVVDGMRSAGLHLSLGDRKASFEGQLIVGYAGQKDGVKDFLRLLDVEEDKTFHPGDLPHMQISYPYGEPWKMIEAMPRSINSKNSMEKFWAKGARAAETVKLKLEANRSGHLRYRISDYDKCTSRWSGILSELADTHFPVESQELLRALNDLQNQFGGESSDLMNWLPRHLRLISTLLSCRLLNLTDSQMDLYLCYQCLVLGYWYKLLDTLVSMQKTDADVYLTCLWGFEDAYLLKVIENTSFFIRAVSLDVSTDIGLTREQMLRLLGVMYAGKQAPSEGSVNVLKHGLLALIGNISVVCMSLFHPSDDPTQISKFVILTLPILNLLQQKDGELWAGKEAGMRFHQAPQSEVQALSKVKAKGVWTVHTKRCVSEGSPSGIVLAARCDGILVGTFDPAGADAVIIAGSGDPTAEDGAQDSLPSGYMVTESDFGQGLVLRPYESGQVVLVQSQGNPIMKYAAAGFFCAEPNVVIGSDDIASDMSRLKKRIMSNDTNYDCGIIIG